jgi:hypothetical protein
MKNLLRLYGDWATLTPVETYAQSLLSSFEPTLRVIFGCLLIYWMTNNESKKPRMQTALLFGVITAFYTMVELSPFLLSIRSGGGGGSNGGEGNNVASVSLRLLTLFSFFVGMAIGSLIPRVVGGLGLGGVLGLMVASCLGSDSEGLVGGGGHPVGLLASIGGAVLVGGVCFRCVCLFSCVWFVVAFFEVCLKDAGLLETTVVLPALTVFVVCFWYHLFGL